MQASSHLVNKLAYIFFSRKFKVLSKNNEAIISIFTKYHTQKLLVAILVGILYLKKKKTEKSILLAKEKY